MRIVALPVGFYRANRRVAGDVPADALRRALLVEWIDERRARGLSRVEACRLLSVSDRSYDRWRSVLRRFGVRALAARGSRPHNLRRASKRRAVSEHVERLRKRHALGKEKLALLLAQDGVKVSASTVGRVLSELKRRGVIDAIGYARRKGRNRRRGRQRFHARRKAKGERASKPGQLVQLDTLHEYSNQHLRIHFSAVDPINRFAHAKLYPSASSRNAQAFLEECLRLWPHPIESLQVDNGSEFKGHHERACQQLNLTLVTIPPATPKANGKVERLQRTFRDEHYAYEPPALTLQQANEHLRTYLDFYNHQRPHKALAMRTPMTYAEDRNPRAVKRRLVLRAKATSSVTN